MIDKDNACDEARTIVQFCFRPRIIPLSGVQGWATAFHHTIDNYRKSSEVMRLYGCGEFL
jgi:hypothetical protein